MNAALSLVILISMTLLAGILGGWIGAALFDGVGATVLGVFIGFLVGSASGAIVASLVSR